MKIVNLTGHEVTLVGKDEKRVTVNDGGYLHVYSDTRLIGSVDLGEVTLPLLEIREQELDLPEDEPDTLYVVSGVVAAKVKRDNFVTPARVVRKSGIVVGCRALARVK